MQRPWTEVLEDLSLNHLEYQVLRRGHYLRRLLERDKGTDATMEHYNEDRIIDNGEVRFQLKATSNLKTIRNGTVIPCRVKTPHLQHWSQQHYPFVLVMYDGATERAYWLHIQPYVGRKPWLAKSERDSVTVHIPFKNRLTLKAIDRFRRLSLDAVQRKRDELFGPRQGGHPRVPK